MNYWLLYLSLSCETAVFKVRLKLFTVIDYLPFFFFNCWLNLCVLYKFKTVIANNTNNLCTFYYQTIAVKRKNALSSIFDEAVEMIHYASLHPQCIHLFKILCDEMGRIQKALLLSAAIPWLPWGKHRWGYSVASYMSCFLNRTPFLHEGVADL